MTAMNEWQICRTLHARLLHQLGEVSVLTVGTPQALRLNKNCKETDEPFGISIVLESSL